MAIATCPTRADLDRLVRGGISADAADALERHVQECPSCVESLKVLSGSGDTLVDALRGDTHTDPPAPPVLQELMAKLHALGAGLSIPHEGTAMANSNAEPNVEGMAAQGDLNSALTNPSSSKADATLDIVPAQDDHGVSLTDFLAPPQAADELGRLGTYRILKILGHGGMGVVYQAEDTKLKRLVALKAMLPTLAASASAGKRFLREAEAMAAVEHDHIVRIYQIDEDRGVPYMAMEFLKGEPLDERLKREDKLPLGDVLRIGREIAEALAAAHHRGLIHRDIKPGNIWLESVVRSQWSVAKDKTGDVPATDYGPLTTDHRVKLLDFGLARAATQDSGLTQQGAIIGTPAYMAPEQGRGGTVDARSDLFSLGVVLYRMATGRQPFVGKDTVSTLMAVAMDQPTPPVMVNLALPQEFSDLVMKLLEKDPAKRLDSAGEVAHALEQMERELPRKQDANDRTEAARVVRPESSKGVLAPRETATPFGVPQGVPPKSRRRLSVAAGLLLVALLTGGAYLAGIIRIGTDQGDYVIATDDPDFSFSVNKGTVVLEDKKTKRTYNLNVVKQKGGEFELEITDPGNDLAFNSKTFSIKRGEKVALKAWFERKQVAVVAPPESGDFALDFGVGAYVDIPSINIRSTSALTLEGYFTRGNKVETAFLLGAHEEIALATRGHQWHFGMQRGSGYGIFSEAPIVSHRRVHVAGVQTAQTIRLFIDGKLVAETRVTDGNSPLVRSGNNFQIGGGGAWTGDKKTTRPFRGIIDEVRVSTCERYVKEFTPAKRFEKDADTLALYHFDEGAGDKLTDSSGNNHHGKIVGAKWVKAAGSPVLPPGATPVDDAWLKMVAALPAKEQVDAVAAKLKELNPGFDGKVTPLIEGPVVTQLLFRTDSVKDISPVRGLPGLRALSCYPTWSGNPQPDGDWTEGRLVDLSSLKDLNLTTLNCQHTKVTDLSALKDMKLTALNCDYTKISDLSPLTGMNLILLSCEGTQVTDLSPLKGMKLINLNCSNIRASDLSPLQGMPLKQLQCDFCPERDAAILRSIKTLETINGQPAAEFWKKVDAQQAGFNAWLKQVALLPAKEQVDVVAAKLKELNPGFDGKVTPTIDKEGIVTGFEFWTDHVANIAPVRALTGLKSLSCFGNKAGQGKLVELASLKDMTLTQLNCCNNPVRDLTALSGLRLVSLECCSTDVVNLAPLSEMKLTRLICYHTKVSDLTPLKGMDLSELQCQNTLVADLAPLKSVKLTYLAINGTGVTDLRPLQGMPLKSVHCDFRPERDAAILRSIKTLETINGQPAAEFWKNVNAQQAGFDAWLKQVAALPAKEQVDAVAAKLKELNPGFDGKMTSAVDDGVVRDLRFLTENVKDISPVRALTGLRSLNCYGGKRGKGQLIDLSPLKGMNLSVLGCEQNNVMDLSPLKDMKLIELNCSYTTVVDLLPLKDMKLTVLDCGATKISDLSPLKDMKLRELNCIETEVSDLSPLKDMKLTTLKCGMTKVTDLSALKGMKLTILNCAATQVSDLSPLKDMKLAELRCHQTKVSDLAPVKNMPLTRLDCDFRPERDAAILRSIKTLETINGMPAAEFWKQVETK